MKIINPIVIPKELLLDINALLINLDDRFWEMESNYNKLNRDEMQEISNDVEVMVSRIRKHVPQDG